MIIKESASIFQNYSGITEQGSRGTMKPFWFLVNLVWLVCGTSLAHPRFAKFGDSRIYEIMTLRINLSYAMNITYNLTT